MRLHQNIEIFRQAVQFTAQEMGIPEIYVEKDYWVTFALHTIFTNPIGKETVFKGGTALAKCFQLINRLSEDIDLVVLRREGETNNKLSNKLKEISKVVSNLLPEVELEQVTQKMGMNRKTAHSYPKEFSGNYGQVRDVIIVEATWLGYFEPYTTKALSTFIYEMMLRNNQQALVEEYRLEPFDVLVLKPERTLCEKIMSLVRFSYTETPVEDLKMKIRHAYDLHLMLLNNDLQVFFNSREFETLLVKVANDDVVSFKNNNEWLQHHPKDARIFSDTENVWNEIKSTYTNEFKNLVFGEFPNEAEIKGILQNIANRLKPIKWAIKFT